MYERYLWIGLIILIAVAIIELWKPKWINEGFSNLITVGDSLIWAQWVPRRGDISLDPTEEQGGYTRDPRYFAGYTDVQRLGQDHDFCRIVQSSGDDTDKFFACALGGTEGLSSVVFRSPSVKEGFQLSRDDYMNDVLKDGREGYCRILKIDSNTFEAKCNPADDHGFKEKMITDSNPPADIKTLLTFYEGIMFWLRLRDDILDYAKNLTITSAGNIEMDETPNPPVTHGLEFNGEDQFLRIGDAPDLSFGNIVELKYLRATTFWVYFEEFTNNAKIFDFGNGAGKDNVFVGIIGRGNAGVQQEVTSSTCPIDQSLNTVPAAPSGAQCTEEVSPQMAMATSAANVNLWDCPKPELFGRIMPPLIEKAAPDGEAKTADLLYEIFDSQMRKLHIQVKDVIPLRKWVHIVITTEGGDPWKPALTIYASGKVVHREDAAWLPQTNYTSHNYIGKSNWADRASGMANQDELFKGKLFDFRGYQMAMTEKKVKDTYAWGKKMLGLDADE